MTDSTEEITQRKLGVSFRRKINIEALGGPKYESAELFMHVDDYVPLDVEPADVAAKLRDMASTVKATCLDESGLDWEATEEGVVIERLRGAFPGAQVQVQPAQQRAIDTGSTPAVQAAPSADAPPHYVKGQKLDFKADKAKIAEQRDWAVERFVALGGNALSEFYDNRESKPKSTSPDFRHKEYGISIWADNVTKAGGTLP